MEKIKELVDTIELYKLSKDWSKMDLYVLALKKELDKLILVKYKKDFEIKE